MVGYSTVYFVAYLYGSKQQFLSSSSFLGERSNGGKVVMCYLRTSNQLMQRVLQLA